MKQKMSAKKQNVDAEGRVFQKSVHLSSDKKVRTAKGLLAKLQMLLHTAGKGNVRISYVWTTKLSGGFYMCI